MENTSENVLPVSDYITDWLAELGLSVSIKLREVPVEINEAINFVGIPDHFTMLPQYAVLDDSYLNDESNITLTVTEYLASQLLVIEDVHYWPVFKVYGSDGKDSYETNHESKQTYKMVFAGFGYIINNDVMNDANDYGESFTATVINIHGQLRRDLRMIGGQERGCVYDITYRDECCSSDENHLPTFLWYSTDPNYTQRNLNLEVAYHVLSKASVFDVESMLTENPDLQNPHKPLGQ